MTDFGKNLKEIAARQRAERAKLREAAIEAALDQRVADIKSGKITEGPKLLAELFPRRQ
jgi:hypothetical protein